MLPVHHATRELRRRAVRSLLTVGGIAIGVAGLVLLGALSEKLGRLMQGGRSFATGQINVSSAGDAGVSAVAKGGLLSGDQLAALERVAGVRDVAPIVTFPLSATPSEVPFTLAPLVFGVDLVRLAGNTGVEPPRLRAGTLLPAPDGGETVIGIQVARLYHLDVGDTLEIRGTPFRVVGVLEETFSGPDSFVFVPFPVASRMLIDSEPMLRRLVLTPGTALLPLATAAAVFWDTTADPERVSERIRAEVPNVAVVSPADAAAQLDRAMAFLNGVTLGSAIVALLVASLAVANTMFTAVTERRREIGLRRVVGATRGQVVAQLVVEAAMVGFIGSALGTATGAVAVATLNRVTAQLGTPVFLLTPRLVTTAIIAPMVLATVAGLWPAWRASRLSPTEALRYS